MKIMELGHYHHCFINYHVALDNLEGAIPPGLELDLFENKPVVSWVASSLQDMKCLRGLWSIKEPTFSLSLRTYVKKKVGSEMIRGFLPIQTWFSKGNVTRAYRWLGIEKSELLEIQRSVHFEPFEKSSRGVFQYSWNEDSAANHSILKLRTLGAPQPALAGYLEFFTAEKYYQFSNNRNASSAIFHERSPWYLWEIDESLLPSQWPESSFSFLNEKTPISVFVAKGSKVSLFKRKV
ncbi:MAG: DUF2071 domain-containing protein [Deltaproteobacteria bacterium]